MRQDFIAQLGVVELLDREVLVKERQRGFSEGTALLGLLWNMILGGDCLLDLTVLRGEAGARALRGVEPVLAPTTAGEHRRKFHLGAWCDLRRALRQLTDRVRPRQPSDTCTIDLAASVYAQCAKRKTRLAADL